jgi:N-[(2S)-2-amino-2-carboxyethyl]-L-glutamate dehydrogenase
MLEAGCLDFQLAMDAAESALLAHRNGDVLFPEKIVQIFNDDTQERINCLAGPARTGPGEDGGNDPTRAPS